MAPKATTPVPSSEILPGESTSDTGERGTPLVRAITPEPAELAVTSWKQWQLRRRTSDTVSIADICALSFGIRPDRVDRLNARTSPSLRAYNDQLKFLKEVIDSGQGPRLLPSTLLEHGNPGTRLISFSGFMDYALSQRLALPERLWQLDRDVREAQRRSSPPRQITEANHNGVAAASNPRRDDDRSYEAGNRGLAYRYLEITFGALLLMVTESAKKKQPLPSSLLRGANLNRSELAAKLEAEIKKHLGEGVSAGPGYTHGAIRKRIGQVLTHFPGQDQSELDTDNAAPAPNVNLE